MPKVVCALENAADEISGVKFSPLEEGLKISDEISDDMAALFLSIDGYKLHEEEKEQEPVPVVKAPARSAKKTAAAPVAEKPVVAPVADPVVAPAAEQDELARIADDGGAELPDTEGDNVF